MFNFLAPTLAVSKWQNFHLNGIIFKNYNHNLYILITDKQFFTHVPFLLFLTTSSIKGLPLQAVLV